MTDWNPSALWVAPLLADSGPFWQAVGGALPGIIIVVLIVRHFLKKRQQGK